MRRVVLALVVSFSLALIAACAAIAPSGISELNPDTGRFHQQHAKRLGLACNSCHASEQTDVLFLRKDEPQGLGPVDRNTCLSCHKTPSVPTWYGASSR